MTKHQLSLLAAAVSCAACVSAAQAGDIQMFGFFDQGISYLHEELNAGMGGPAGQSLTNPAEIGPDGYVARAATKSQLAQGTGNVSTWGMKGGEQINDDTKVIFHLESGFLADDGTIYGGKNQIFERESSLGFDSKKFGQLKFGRMPALTTGSGTTGIFNSRVNPFGAGWGNMTGGWKFAGTLATARYDNMINYISPKFGGLQFHAQYSFKNSLSGTDEGTSDADRWWAVGATLTGEKFFLAAAVDCVDYGKVPLNKGEPAQDAYKFLIGGNYNFDAFKLYGTFQYMKSTPWIGGYSTKEVAPMLGTDMYQNEDGKFLKDEEGNRINGHVGQKGFDAWAVSTGVDFKALGGTVKMSVAYAQAENQNVTEKNDMQRVNAGLGYVYSLSKRTSIYGIGGYFWQDADWQKDNISAHEVIVGLMHRW